MFQCSIIKGGGSTPVYFVRALLSTMICNTPGTAYSRVAARRHQFLRKITICMQTKMESTRTGKQNYSSTNVKGKSETQIARTIVGTIPLNGKGIKIGQFAECHASFSQQDVTAFGTLICDMNPVHFPCNDQKNEHEFDEQHMQMLQRPLVHGMLLSSLFSSIFGTLIPGSIYRSQSLRFSNSVGVGEKITGRVIVQKLKQVTRNGNGVLCTCETLVFKAKDIVSSDNSCDDKVIAISGEAQVWLPRATVKTD
ncbi:hypothetical protein ACHAW6_007476 [Cyclotella cf. meneghiniana]